MANLNSPEPLPKEAQEEFEKLRAAHKLRALTPVESGAGVDRLPNGVFGFTYSPCEDNFPLFDSRDLRSFEGHKLEDGVVFLLGFLTREERQTFEKTTEAVTLHLFPEPKGQAGELVRVPVSRVRSHGENSARRGNGLEIQLGPAS
jgi:hypothetical protein